MKIKYLALLFIGASFTLSSCSESTTNSETENINPEAHTGCAITLEGMMCDRGCKITIQSRLREKEGIIKCDVDYENKKASLEFDNRITDCKSIINTVNIMVDSTYKATLIEEESINYKNNSLENNTSETDEVSVSSYNWSFPDLTSIFTDLI